MLNLFEHKPIPAAELDADTLAENEWWRRELAKATRDQMNTRALPPLYIDQVTATAYMVYPGLDNKPALFCAHVAALDFNNLTWDEWCDVVVWEWEDEDHGAMVLQDINRLYGTNISAADCAGR